MAIYRILYRYDCEPVLTSAHRSDVQALDKVDAEGVVKYRAAICGLRAIIVKSYKLEEDYDRYPKRHAQPRTYRRD